jgi:hypothetical protein
MASCIDTLIETIESTSCLRNSLPVINNNFNELNEIVCTLRERANANKQIRTFFYYGPNAQVAPASGMDDNLLTRPSNLTIEAFANSPSQLNLPAISNPGDVAYVLYQKTGFQGALPSQSSGFNPQTGSSQNYSIGRSVTLQFNKWYNVDDYHSVTAAADGTPNNLATINVKFKTPTGQTAEYNYTATGMGDDTYMEWDPYSVIWSEGYPAPKTTKGLIPRPFKNTPGTQFLFSVSGSPVSSTLSAFLKKVATTPGLTPASVTNDLKTQISPTFIIWKLNYIDTQYYVEIGFPKFTKGSTSNTGTPNSNWNKPQNWTTFESWT